VIVSGRALVADTVLEHDVVVVGTGAGGSMTTRELARAGKSVIAVEEGGDHTPADFDQREDTMLPILFQDRGGRMTTDLAITVLQGRGVGGSTIHNTNLCKRAPDAILELWAQRHGVVGCTPGDLAPVFEEVERDLSVSRIPDDAINKNNDALRRGLAALGWRGGALSHNRVGCMRSGFCELGCAYDAKQNARKVLLPEAVTRGATVLCDTTVLRILHDGRRVSGVLARTVTGKLVRIRARAVVLSASATGSAALALVSGVPDPFDQIGRGLRIHPGGAIAGVFDDTVDGWQGIPQSWECTEHLDFAEGSDKRVWITTAFAHPIGTASLMPGFGADHMRAMRLYRRMAVLTAMVHDETEGQVTASPEGKPRIAYSMEPRDRAQLAKGLRAGAEILLAAGAKEVHVPAVRPLIVRTKKDLAAIDLDFARPHSVPLTAVHPMGTMRMGEDRRRSVVDSRGRHHHLAGLFVADGSLFPTSLGGPPQISVYTLARHLARHVADSVR